MSLRSLVDCILGASSQHRLPLDPGTVHALLSSPRRREALRILDENGGAVTMSQLARTLAAREMDYAPEEVPGEDRNRVRVALYQGHLPRLEGKGVIEWTPDSRTVEATSVARSLLEIIEFVDDRTTESSEA